MITTIQSENSNWSNVAYSIAPICRKSRAGLSIPGHLEECKGLQETPKTWMNWVLGIYWNQGLRCSREAWESFPSVAYLCFSPFILLFLQTCFLNFPIYITENHPTHKSNGNLVEPITNSQMQRLVCIAWYKNSVLAQQVTAKRVNVQKWFSHSTTWITRKVKLPGKGWLNQVWKITPTNLAQISFCPATVFHFSTQTSSHLIKS